MQVFALIITVSKPVMLVIFHCLHFMNYQWVWEVDVESWVLVTMFLDYTCKDSHDLVQALPV